MLPRTSLLLDDIPTRIQHAKEFLQENPGEKANTAARIFGLQPTTLRSALNGAPTSGIRGGHNKILQEHHKEAIHQFIWSLLAYEIQPTYQLVITQFAASNAHRNRMISKSQ